MLYRWKKGRHLFEYQHCKVVKQFSLKWPVLRPKTRQMAQKNLAEKRNITPEMAVKYLQKNGIEIDEKKAAEILDFLYILAKLTVNQYVKGDGDKDI